MKIYDTVIIGGGPAGLCAGLYLARGGFDVALFEGGFLGGQASLTSNIENYPGFDGGISGIDLAMKMETQARSFGLKVLYDEVKQVQLDGDIKMIVTDAGEVGTKTVIIAGGAVPRKLGQENEEKLTGRGISYCATCDGAFFMNKTVAVIGGGNTAAEDALFLSKTSKRVYIVHRRDELRAEQAYKKKIAESDKIEVLYESKLTKILENNGVVCGMEIDRKGTAEQFDLEGIFVAIGTVPKSEPFEQLKKNDSGYIITDENMKTNISGVYAAGDIREKSFRQVVTAVSDGAVAANSAALFISGGIV